MIVKTKLSEQSEQFELDGVHYVGRRVLWQSDHATSDESLSEISDRALVKCGRDSSKLKLMILFRLDYDRGLIFVDPAILKPYQRPERKEEAGT